MEKCECVKYKSYAYKRKETMPSNNGKYSQEMRAETAKYIL